MNIVIQRDAVPRCDERNVLYCFLLPAIVRPTQLMIRSTRNGLKTTPLPNTRLRSTPLPRSSLAVVAHAHKESHSPVSLLLFTIGNATDTWFPKDKRWSSA